MPLADFRKGLRAFEELYPADAALLACLPADSVLLPGCQGMAMIAIDVGHLPVPGAVQTMTLHVHFLAAGWTLLAVDDALIDRSSPLAAYDPSPIGIFSFGIRRYPVIFSGDIVTSTELIVHLDHAKSYDGRRGINPADPMALDGRRMRFPVPGEYYLQINDSHFLKLLVLPRNSRRTEFDPLIRNFVADNCITQANETVVGNDASVAADLGRWLGAEEPVRLSKDSELAITKLLQASAASGSSP